MIGKTFQKTLEKKYNLLYNIIMDITAYRKKQSDGVMKAGEKLCPTL